MALGADRPVPVLLSLKTEVCDPNRLQHVEAMPPTPLGCHKRRMMAIGAQAPSSPSAGVVFATGPAAKGLPRSPPVSPRLLPVPGQGNSLTFLLLCIVSLFQPL